LIARRCCDVSKRWSTQVSRRSFSAASEIPTFRKRMMRQPSTTQSLSELPFPGPPRLRTGRTDGGEIACTVYAFDFPGLFSLITGLLAVSGYDIRTGTVHTFGPEHETARYRVRNRGRYKTFERSIEKPRLIIDSSACFGGIPGRQAGSNIFADSSTRPGTSFESPNFERFWE